MNVPSLRHTTLTEIESVIGYFPDAVVLVDPHGTVVGANALAGSLFGYDAAELCGLTVEDLIPRRYTEDHASHRAAFARDPHTRPMGIGKELLALHKDGVEIPVEISLSPMTAADGLLIMAVVRDISERKRAERALIESREQLRRLSAYLQQAREEERTAIAREIHDELGQSLTALKMDLVTMEELLQEDAWDMAAPQVTARIQSMSDLINATVQTVRKISTQLRPVLLDSLGLVPAIEWQVEEFQTRTGIRCSVDVSPEDFTLDMERSIAVFRILQEALTNVARHSMATEVNILLSLDEDQLRLSVCDNGRGIADDDLNQTKSFGLLGMRERVLMFGGDISITGEAGEGTTIAASIPIAPDLAGKGDV